MPNKGKGVIIATPTGMTVVRSSCGGGKLKRSRNIAIPVF